VFGNSKIGIDYFFIVAVISTLIFSNMTIVNSFTNIVYGQTNGTQTDSSKVTTNLVNIQDIQLEKVKVGDIEVAYKMFGKGDPLILFNGASENMDAWDPSFLTEISSNHTVIAFDQRGIGNSTVGSKPYTYLQLANDTAGLLDVLKITKADVMGYSLGGHIAQAFTISHPEKVSTLILVASSCGGKDSIPKPDKFKKLQDDVVNKTLHNLPIAQELKALNVASLGSGWVKLHPESADVPANITSLQQLKPGLTPEMTNKQNSLGIWEDTNWRGACDAEAKLAKPTLVITGTDDNDYMPHENALIIASKVPGSWLVQIKDAGHAIMNQYPEEVGKIINTFLSTTN
jgi:pimeloyl-ACP methyl ester carboxylesterase